MTPSEAIAQLHPIFLEVLDLEEVTLTPDTTAQDIEEWDSLNHIQLVVAVEKHFQVRFTSSEIQSWKNVGEMVQNIIAKKG
jgi:acyl carrier protein